MNKKFAKNADKITRKVYKKVIKVVQPAKEVNKNFHFLKDFSISAWEGIWHSGWKFSILQMSILTFQGLLGHQKNAVLDLDQFPSIWSIHTTRNCTMAVIIVMASILAPTPRHGFLRHFLQWQLQFVVYQHFMAKYRLRILGLTTCCKNNYRYQRPPLALPLPGHIE